jgi:hypothetical protein
VYRQLVEKSREASEPAVASLVAATSNLVGPGNAFKGK